MPTNQTTINPFDTPFYQTNKVWDTHLLTQYLQNLGLVNNRKGTDRWLLDQGCLPNPLNDNSLHDEQHNPLKVNVLKQIIHTTKRSRNSLLFIQSFTHQDINKNQHYGLFANDAKGSRRWLWNDQPWDTTSLAKALNHLVHYCNKDTLFLPHGVITGLFRQLNCQGNHLILSDSEFVKQNSLSNTPKAMLGLHAYTHYVDLSKQTSTNKTRNKSPIKSTSFMTHLDRLEAESIYIIREVIAQAKNPAMLYSIGKDSSVMLHLARKAFYPSPPPFPLLHVDTRWKFNEMYQFRDQIAADVGMELIVHTNPEGIKRDINPIDHGSSLHTHIMKTEGLKQALDHHQFDFTFGGARRDEEKSRAKERVFSFRNQAHHWDPKNQRPELWQLYNGRKNPGESFRVFPLSNWTELDIWHYIYQESIPIVPLYFAKVRPLVERDTMLIMLDDDRLKLLPDEQIQFKSVRFRTLGCYPLTGAIESDASSVTDIIQELLKTSTSERQGRAIDKDASTSMETKKQEGYF